MSFFRMPPLGSIHASRVALAREPPACRGSAFEPGKSEALFFSSIALNFLFLAVCSGRLNGERCCRGLSTRRNRPFFPWSGGGLLLLQKKSSKRRHEFLAPCAFSGGGRRILQHKNNKRPARRRSDPKHQPFDTPAMWRIFVSLSGGPW
ncbi:MAG: hypothetical protein AB7H71_10605 [Alphaproteobacteria bacterium]